MGEYLTCQHCGKGTMLPAEGTLDSVLDKLARDNMTIVYNGHLQVPVCMSCLPAWLDEVGIFSSDIDELHESIQEIIDDNIGSCCIACDEILGDLKRLLR